MPASVGTASGPIETPVPGASPTSSHGTPRNAAAARTGRDGRKSPANGKAR